MDVAEINRYREYREAEAQLEIKKTILSWDVAERHDASVGGEDDLFELYRNDKPALVAIHLKQLNAIHGMMQRLMLAPRNEAIGAVKVERPYPHFSVKERTIHTPEIGNFVAGARVWRHKRIASTDTRLSLAYLHPSGTHPGYPDFNRTERIVDTVADELTFDRHQYIDWHEPVRAAGIRETVAAVCTQVGVEVIEV